MERLHSLFPIRADAPSEYFVDPPSLHIGYLEAPAAPVDALANRWYPTEEEENETGNRIEVARGERIQAEPIERQLL